MVRGAAWVLPCGSFLAEREKEREPGSNPSLWLLSSAR